MCWFFAALSRRCREAPRSPAAVLSLNHHILGYTKRPAITRNPAWRASSACQVPPTVTSLFTINERFTLHESLPLPILAPAHIRARVFLSSLRQRGFFFLFWFCFVLFFCIQCFIGSMQTEEGDMAAFGFYLQAAQIGLHSP